MVVKVFVLGRPGSGKSTASYCIAGFAWRKGWSVLRIKDYEILRTMFQADTEEKQFHSTQHKGFDVVDFSVFDVALQDMEKQAWGLMPFANQQELIIIEFARDDYGEALRLFSSDFLQNAYVLFVETDLETCIRRIYQRAVHALTADDIFVSDDVLRNYYGKDNMPYILSQLKTDYNLIKHVKIIDNNGSPEDFLEQVIQFVEFIFQQEVGR